MREPIGRSPLPEDRIAQRADAERRNAVQIVEPRRVTVALQLTVVLVAQAVYRALDAGPHLERRRLRCRTHRRLPHVYQVVLLRAASGAACWHPTGWMAPQRRCERPTRSNAAQRSPAPGAD